MNIIGCPDVVEDPYPPDPPRIVSQTTPADLVERGIGPYNFNTENPDVNSIKFMWHPNSEDDLLGYNIYRAIEIPNGIGDFELIYQVDISSTITGRDTFYVDTDITTLKRYYYYLRSLDLAGNKSSTSDTISYKLLMKPHAFSISNGSTSNNLTFYWDEDQSMTNYPQSSVIRINNEDNESIWVCMFQYPFNGFSFNYAPDGSNVNEEAVLDFNGISGYLPPGRYYWKVTSLRMGNGITTDAEKDVAGAESDWIEFVLED